MPERPTRPQVSGTDLSRTDRLRALGLSVRQAAKEIGVSRDTLARYLDHDASLKASTVERITRGIEDLESPSAPGEMLAREALREVVERISAQESCASPAGACYRDHDGCFVHESLMIAREVLARFEPTPPEPEFSNAEALLHDQMVQALVQDGLTVEEATTAAAELAEVARERGIQMRRARATEDER